MKLLLEVSLHNPPYNRCIIAHSRRKINMRKEISVKSLCMELKEQLRLRLSKDSFLRYEEVLTDFSLYYGKQMYSQRLGTEFLTEKFESFGGFSETDETSKKQKYHFKCIRMLAEFYNFEVIITHPNALGEIIWPAGFKKCMDEFLSSLLDEHLSYGYVLNVKRVLKDLILFYDAQSIYSPDQITQQSIDAFLGLYKGLSSSGIKSKICYLKKYFKFLYLHNYVDIPYDKRLPHSSIQGRSRFPTLWTQKEIEDIKNSANRTCPSGKRSYAMILIAANLGLRIGDIRTLKLSDIDWLTKSISIIQNKTQNALTLPLPDEVGWSIIDYLKNARPITESEYVFVRHVPPYDEFGVNSNLNCLLSKVLIKAGIPPEKKINVGWHTFRRSLATHLIQNDIDTYHVAQILGHSDPSITSKYYIRLDVIDIKKCIIPIEVKDYAK